MKIQGFEACDAVQEKTISDLQAMGVELPCLITDETGLERAQRYLTAMEVVDDLDEQQWKHFKLQYLPDNSVAHEAYQQRRWRQEYNTVWAKVQDQKALIGSLGDNNQELMYKLKVSE